MVVSVESGEGPAAWPAAVPGEADEAFIIFRV